MVGQFSVEVNRKDEPGLCRGRLLLSSKPVKMRAFYSGTDRLFSQMQRDVPKPSNALAMENVVITAENGAAQDVPQPQHFETPA